MPHPFSATQSWRPPTTATSHEEHPNNGPSGDEFAASTEVACSAPAEQTHALDGASAREADLENQIALLQGALDQMRNQQEKRRGARTFSDHSSNSKQSAGGVSLVSDAEDVQDVLHAASESEHSYGAAHNSEGQRHHAQGTYSLDAMTNVAVIRGSALAKSRAVQAIIYTIALGGVIFVLVARATHLGEDASGSASASASEDVEVLIAFFLNIMKLPLILGYLLGGVLVGPIGLDIVHSQAEIADMSSLGLVFLLFMIGLELDVSELLKMGKVVIGTGLLQFPLCAAIMTGIFMLFETLGLSWGSGPYAVLYVGMPCGISSTMIVVKLLSEKAEMDTAPGRLTVGILIFQDIWAIVVLAIQPDLANPQVLGILRTFGMITGLVLVALAYAKFVMPAVFLYASKSIELMLIISLAWCFFMCCLATLPFIGLSMELAALISGVALATFPYSAEFNGKIKYIRDFFITLFFVGLGMQIPLPSVDAIAKAVLVALVVLLVRWIGIFAVVNALGGDKRLASVSTINLSQISEFALVICSLGMNYKHITEETLVILIWTFSILAISSSYMIGYNWTIYGMLCRACRKITRRGPAVKADPAEMPGEGEDHVDRNIVLLGFHKIAAMLVAHFEHHNPHLLAKLHVIDFHEHIMPELRKRGVTCAYGDISSPDVLEHAHHGEVRLVICSIPDSMLQGVTNLRLLQIAKQVWPEADVIVSADNPRQAHSLYEAGADYVLRTAKLCAERLHTLISDHSSHTVHHHHVGEEVKLASVFAAFKEKDKDHITKGILV
eukprot:CAMPEP_0115551728 /NCGR_PEP_ID=MMETSP0271-20121206/95877_1 /TAXON_ID=71861 /ORGANISM="Scrippsiella trochoidea, Strain CCMP3099" /LENGTH=783 /DNA_ID=CAMNT_0002985331 /DNA_START=49 /DNA_END=2400 /DNA_ORIENTATION=-